MGWYVVCPKRYVWGVRKLVCAFLGGRARRYKKGRRSHLNTIQAAGGVVQGRGGQGGGGGVPEHHEEGDEHGRDGEEAREAAHKAFGGTQGLCVPGGGR